MSVIVAGGPTQSGTWVDAARTRLLAAAGDIELGIAAGYSVNRTAIDQDGTTYYALGGVRVRRGERAPLLEKQKWSELIDAFRPDVIHLWGTEFTNGLDVMDVAEGILVVLSIQGIMQVIGKHRYGDMRLRDLCRPLGPYDKIRCLGYYARHRQIVRQIPYERELVRRSSGVITDSDWAFGQIAASLDGSRSYRCSMAVGETHLSRRWSHDQCDANRILCIAGTGPHKGIHTALDAIALVKREVPDVQLVIPGSLAGRSGRENPYVAYLRSRISSEGLSGNVRFTGRLDSDDMAGEMYRANAMVMPSCVENQSATLWEAMFLGLPCISAAVGSTHEVIHHAENGMLYRYGEAESLAMYLTRVLQEPKLASSIGGRAYDSIRAMHPQDRVGPRLAHIYAEVARARFANEVTV